MKCLIVAVLALALLAACHRSPTAPEKSCKPTIVNADSVHVVSKCPADTVRP